MKSFYVYVHTCPNGKKYVGLTTTDPKERWGLNGVKYKSNKHFYSAIQKYKWDNIDHQVIEVDTENEMYYLEKYLIAYYQTNKKEFGYNKSSGGEAKSLGCHRSDETKKKMSEAQKGKHVSDETKKKISEALKGKHLSDETKKKISEAHKGVKKSPHSEETKKKISEALKGVKKSPHSEETKKKISEALKGKHFSEETKKKMSEALKGNQYHKGKHHSEEKRRKISESLKRRNAIKKEL